MAATSGSSITRRTVHSRNCPATNGQLTGFHGQAQPRSEQRQGEFNAVYFQAEKPFTDTSRLGLHHGADAAAGAQQCGAGAEQRRDVQRTEPRHLWLGPCERRSEMDVGVSAAIYRAPFGIILSGQLDAEVRPGIRQHHLRSAAPAGRLLLRATWAASSSRRRTSATRASTFAWRRPSRCRGATSSPPISQVFNVFNWLNRTYSTWGAGIGRSAAADRKRPARRRRAQLPGRRSSTSSELKMGTAGASAPVVFHIVAGAERFCEA